MIKNMTEGFFRQLSLYYYNENDLSNVTCALCNSSLRFRERFVHFFFPELDVEEIASIEREVCDENDMHSRVDLFITMKNDPKPWLIEVKIYDQNHHFGQYEAAYEVGKERLGYITNYICKEGLEKGYDVKTWDEWIKHLEGSLNQDITVEELTLCRGYMEYVRKVCGFGNIITSLTFDKEADDNFSDILRLTLNSGALACKTAATTKMQKDGEYNTEAFWMYPDKERVYGGFTGYIKINGNPVICMGFCKTLAKSKDVFNALLANPIAKNEITGECIKMKYFSAPTIVVPMSDAMHEKFLQCGSKSEQIAIMSEFMDFCLKEITERLNG